MKVRGDLDLCLDQKATNFSKKKKCRSHFQIREAIRMTWGEFYIEDKQFWIDLWTLLLSLFLLGACEQLHIYVRK